MGRVMAKENNKNKKNIENKEVIKKTNKAAKTEDKTAEDKAMKDKPIEEKLPENISDENKAEKNVQKTADKYKTTPNEEPREQVKGARKFYNIMDKLGDLFYLNIYFFITCIPIVTIGASITALYTVTNKMVTDDEPPVKQEYFRAFKANFKQSTIIWLIDLVYIYLMYIQLGIVMTNQSEGAKMLFVVLGFEFILAAFAIPLQFPLVARYENTTFNMIKNALILSLAYLSVWFRMFFIWMFPIVIYYLNPKIMFYTWYLWALILTSLFAYACSMFLRKFYDILEKPKE